MRILFGWFVFLALAVGICSAQGGNCISVRVLSEKSAKPIKDVNVRIQLVHSEKGPRDAPIEIGKTDKRGIVSYCVPAPIPDFVLLQLDDFSGPDERKKVNIGVVLEHGVVESNPNQKEPKSAPGPKPGEIVIFGQRWDLIDRWLGTWP